jgi:hypothetical protein
MRLRPLDLLAVFSAYPWLNWKPSCAQLNVLQSAQPNACPLANYHTHPTVYQPYLLPYTTEAQILAN